MQEEIKMESSYDYLEHHGTKGMHWGIRRFQNKDGSLTAAGKKRRANEQADAKVKRIETRTANKIKKMKEEAKINRKVNKAQEKADAKLAKAQEKYGPKKKGSTDDPDQKPKALKDMTNAEIQERIDRIRLEQTLASLTPQQKSKGKEFADTMVNNVIKPVALDVGKKYLQKTLEDKLGLGKGGADDLKKAAEQAGYNKAIAEAKKTAAEANKAALEYKKQQEAYDSKKAAEKKAQEAAEKQAKADEKAAKQARKDAKAAEKAERQAEKDDKKEAEREAQRQADKARQEAEQKARAAEETRKQSEKVYEGTVEGEGTSHFTGWKSGPTVDADYREYTERPTSSAETTALVVSGKQYLDRIWN